MRLPVCLHSQLLARFHWNFLNVCATVLLTQSLLGSAAEQMPKKLRQTLKHECKSWYGTWVLDDYRRSWSDCSFSFNPCSVDRVVGLTSRSENLIPGYRNVLVWSRDFWGWEAMELVGRFGKKNSNTRLCVRRHSIQAKWRILLQFQSRSINKSNMHSMSHVVNPTNLKNKLYQLSLSPNLPRWSHRVSAAQVAIRSGPKMARSWLC